MLRNSISWVFLWAGLLMLFATAPSLAEGGDAGEIASQIQGPSLSHDLGSGLGETPPDMGGAVGPNQLAQILNGSYTVFTRAGFQQVHTTDFGLLAECRRVVEHRQHRSERSAHHIRP